MSNNCLNNLNAVNLSLFIYLKSENIKKKVTKVSLKTVKHAGTASCLSFNLVFFLFILHKHNIHRMA